MPGGGRKGTVDTPAAGTGVRPGDPRHPRTLSRWEHMRQVAQDQRPMTSYSELSDRRRRLMTEPMSPGRASHLHGRVHTNRRFPRMRKVVVYELLSLDG